LKFKALAISKSDQIFTKLTLLEKRVGTVRSHSTPLFVLDGLDLDNATFVVLDHMNFLTNEAQFVLNNDFKSTGNELRSFKEKLRNCLKEEYKVEEDLINLVRGFF
jgi:hypothetical protein